MENVPINFELFRGGWTEQNRARSKIGISPNYLKNNRGTFFTYGVNGKNLANREYGPVVSYKTTRPLRLLRITNKNVFNFLRFQAEHQRMNNLVIAFNKAFKFQPNGRIIRTSKEKYDFPIVNFLCSLGYDGYIAGKLNKKYGGTFHQEIVLCKPTQILKVNKVFGETPLSSSRGRPSNQPSSNYIVPTNMPTINFL